MSLLKRGSEFFRKITTQLSNIFKSNDPEPSITISTPDNKWQNRKAFNQELFDLAIQNGCPIDFVQDIDGVLRRMSSIPVATFSQEDKEGQLLSYMALILEAANDPFGKLKNQDTQKFVNETLLPKLLEATSKICDVKLDDDLLKKIKSTNDHNKYILSACERLVELKKLQSQDSNNTEIDIEIKKIEKETGLDSKDMGIIIAKIDHLKKKIEPNDKVISLVEQVIQKQVEALRAPPSRPPVPSRENRPVLPPEEINPPSSSRPPVPSIENRPVLPPNPPTRKSARESFLSLIKKILPSSDSENKIPESIKPVEQQTIRLKEQTAAIKKPQASQHETQQPAPTQQQEESSKMGHSAP